MRVIEAREPSDILFSLLRGTAASTSLMRSPRRRDCRSSILHGQTTFLNSFRLYRNLQRCEKGGFPMSNTHNASLTDKFFEELQGLIKKFPEINIDLCATYVSPGVLVDAGGFVIVGGHIHRVPGWNPEGTEFAKGKVAVTAAATTIASLIKEPATRKEVETTVMKNVAVVTPKTRTTTA
jgi:hypothetical protein